jgi:hypothetical protein
MSPPESDTADPLVPKAPRNRRGRRLPSSDPRECTVEHARKALLPPLDEAKPRLTAGLSLHLRVATYGDSPTCGGAPACRRRRSSLRRKLENTPKLLRRKLEKRLDKPEGSLDEWKRGIIEWYDFGEQIKEALRTFLEELDDNDAPRKTIQRELEHQLDLDKGELDSWLK